VTHNDMLKRGAPALWTCVCLLHLPQRNLSFGNFPLNTQ